MRTEKNFGKILALILSLALAFSAMPVTVIAEEEAFAPAANGEDKAAGIDIPAAVTTPGAVTEPPAPSAAPSPPPSEPPAPGSAPALAPVPRASGEPEPTEPPEPGVFAPSMRPGLPAFTVNGPKAETPVFNFGGEREGIGDFSWYAVGYNGGGLISYPGTMTLFAEASMRFDGFGWRDYSGAEEVPLDNRYYDSYLRGVLSPNAPHENEDPGIYSEIDEKERALMMPQELVDVGYAPEPVRDQLWSLSKEEALSLNRELRESDGEWWLRSPGFPNDYADAMTSSGNFIIGHKTGHDGFYYVTARDTQGGLFPDAPEETKLSEGTAVNITYAVRPAFILDLSTALFTFPAGAAGGKAAASAGGGLVRPQGGALKFTMKHPSQTLDISLSGGQAAQSGGTLSFNYSNATTGANQYVSCVLINGNNEAVYYGKLADSSSAAGGTLSVPLAGVEDGNYTMFLFGEQANGEMSTDFCSEPATIPLSVLSGVGTVNLFSGDAPQILMDFADYMLDYDATGVTMRVLNNFGDSGIAANYRVTVTGANGAAVTKEGPRVGAAEYTEFKFPFGEGGLSRILSGYDTAEDKYIPSYTITAEADVVIDGVPVELERREGSVYLLPPYAKVSTQANLPAAVIAGSGSLSVPVTLSNLSDATGYEAGWTLSKNGAVTESAINLNGFTRTQNGDTFSLSGNLTINPGAPADADAEDTYILTVYGKNYGHSRTVLTRQISVIDPSLSHLTATYYDSANQPSALPGAGGAAQGARLAEIAALAEGDTVQSQQIVDYLYANRPGNTHLTLDAPAAWGRVRYRINEAANAGGQPYWSPWASPAAAYSLTSSQGKPDTFTFMWEHSLAEYTLKTESDPLNGKVFLFKLDGNKERAAFSYTSGGRNIEKQVVPNADGIYALYAPEGMEGVEIRQTRGDTIYIGVLENPRGAFSFGSSAGVSALSAVPGGDYKTTAPALTVNNATLTGNAALRLSFVAGNGEPLNETVGVKYFFVNKDFTYVSSVPGNQSNVGPGGYAAVNINPVVDNPDYMILVEITRGGQPMLYVLEHQSLNALGAGKQSNDILLKLCLPDVKDGAFTMQPALLKDDTGTRAVYGSADTAESFYDTRGADYTLIAPASAITGSHSALRLETPAGVSLTNPSVTVLSGENLPPLANSYIMAKFGITGRFERDRRHPNVRLVDGSRTVAHYVGLVFRSEAEDIMDFIRNNLKLPEFTESSLKEIKNSNMNGDLLSKLADFSFETPAWGPISFAVSKTGDTYIIKGVASASVLPDPSMLNPQEVLDVYKELSDAYTVAQGSDVRVSEKFFQPMGGGNVFVGGRLFLGARATLNKTTNDWDFEFHEGGLMLEISGNLTSRHAVPGIGETAYTIAGKGASTLSFGYPTKRYRDKAADGLLVDISLESVLEASLTARAGVGLDVFIASTYVGVEGGVSAFLGSKVTTRPYLPSTDSDKTEGGMKISANGSLRLYWSKQFLWYESTEYHPLLYGYWEYLSEGNNPYRTASNSAARYSGILPTGANFRMLDTSIFSNVQKPGVDASAAAQFGGNGYLYKDIGAPADYNDDRVKDGNGAVINATPIGSEYSLSVSSKLAAWEAYAGEIIDTSPESINAAIAKTEIIGGYFNGANWVTKRLSENGMMDMSPKTAFNDAAGKGVVVWTSGNAVSRSTQTLDIGVSGEIFYSVFNGSDFEAAQALMPLPAEGEAKIVSIVPEVDGGGRILILIRFDDGRMEIVNPETGVRAVPAVNAIGADLIYNGAEYVLAAVDAESNFIVLTSTDGVTFAQKSANAALATRVSPNFRLARDTAQTGMDSLAVVWHELAAEDESFAAVFKGAVITGRNPGEIQFSSPQVIDTIAPGVSVASFDPRFNAAAKAVSLLAVCAVTGETPAAITTAEAEFKNSVSAAVVSFDTQALKPGSTSDIQLIVQNDGLVPITGLSVTIGGNPPVVVDKDIETATSVVVTVPYTPAAGTALSAALPLKVTASFTDGGTASVEWTHNTYMVDLAVSLLNFSGETNSAVVSVSGMSDLPLAANSSVTLGAYYDPYGNEPVAGSQVTLSGAEVNSVMETGLAQSLTMPQAAEPAQLFIAVSTKDGGAEVTDINKANNSVAVLIEPAESGGSSGGGGGGGYYYYGGGYYGSGVAKITLSSSTLALKPGESSKLIPTVTPNYAANPAVVWSTDNPAVATVNNDGTVTAVAPGKAVITASSSDGLVSARCEVTVSVGDSSGGGSAAGVIAAVSGNNAVVDVDTETIEALLKSALDELKDTDAGATGEVIINVTGLGSATSLKVNFKARDLETVAEEENLALTVQSTLGTVTLDNAALKGLLDETARRSAAVSITVSKPEQSGLTEAERGIIGGSPLFDLTVTVDGNVIHDFKGTATVLLPYEPEAGEDTDRLTVKHLAENGDVTDMADSSYVSDRKGFLFTTDHFSLFFIAEKAEAAEPAGVLEEPVALEAEAAWENPYPDVTEADWFYGAVRYASENKLMNGVDGGLFSPGTNLTRAMMAAILFNSEGKPAVSGGMTFGDVDGADWYFGAVAWASAEGVAQGYGGLFNPNDSITREQLVTMLFNYAKLKGYDMSKTADLTKYTDLGEVSGYAKEPMSWASANGIIAGRTPTALVPQGTATRAEAAAFIMNFIEAFK